MSPLSADARRLIVEAGLAAVNHGLHREAWAIHAALPALIPDAHDRLALEAVMLIGLGRSGSAARLLERASAQHAQLLAPLLSPPAATPRGLRSKES
ncbi:EscG/YscG/SsaH family type III secretion system needle protein co-chaperone (plasmid) [Burkholderia sp. FERM BP-3421]|jgi:type III secretion system SsaH family protein|uniref:EscG/YscG/SsaH family type III secretion system needle protein co-chaperone n=1 Tax=Burkholderia sp. FERM BP-3421 TaxID=1494466 RepID=UPI00235FF227|nr:EscG/YscG/SsaH family type III secretion system needle protein co-chaperone [Burkholderia sp. FERM BP-3421]WDD90568.1 EscG/YscG/SsaH family type III secretion system needle protein co-chaperone [Burkholderia sp. FERM BP-3421]